MTIAAADVIAERYARVREDVGSSVTVVVATKYVSAEQMSALADAGVEVVGENRAQDLEQKHALYGDAFRWHFIGHLQSNKVKVVNALCELVHSLELGLGSEASHGSGAPRGEPLGRSIEVRRIPGRGRRPRRALPAHPGADDDAAVRNRPGGRPGRRFAGCVSSRPSTASPS